MPDDPFEIVINEFRVVTLRFADKGMKEWLTEQSDAPSDAKIKEWLIENFDRFPAFYRDLIVHDKFSGETQARLLEKYPRESSDYDVEMLRKIFTNAANYEKNHPPDQNVSQEDLENISENIKGAATWFSRFFRLRTKTDHILVVGSTIITYQFSGNKHLKHSDRDVSALEDRIREILAANPKADLARLENTLGISIVDIQRHSDSAGGTQKPREQQSDPPKLKDTIL
jgi:hypothetical protein